MTVAERLGAAIATAGLSMRVSELYRLDRSDDEAVAAIPAQRGASLDAAT